MDPICLHFGLSPEFTGNLWAESKAGGGWASHPVLSSTISGAQGHGWARDPKFSLGTKGKKGQWALSWPGPPLTQSSFT